MGIYVYVTRKPDPLESKGPEIGRAEWIRLVAEDPDLTLKEPPNLSPRDEGIYAAWSGYSGGYDVWFSLWDGNVEVKNPDDEIIDKLRFFAGKLNARIVSEEGEEFS